MEQDDVAELVADVAAPAHVGVAFVVDDDREAVLIGHGRGREDAPAGALEVLDRDRMRAVRQQPRSSSRKDRDPTGMR